MMEKFAKLFESEQYGQIVVIADTNDNDAPELKVSFKPPELGVCHLAIAFKDSGKGYDLRDKALDDMDLEKASSFVKTVFDDLGIGEEE